MLQGPFTVRWFDGRESKILVDGCLESDIDDRTPGSVGYWWGKARDEGAVVLIDGDNVVRASNYTPGGLAAVGIRPGARVRHKNHPDLVGVVHALEWQTTGPGEPAKLSPMPVCVHWDDSGAAHDRLGWFFVYPSAENLEPLDPVPAEPEAVSA